MSTWNIEIEISDGSFVADGTIPVPNQDMETSYTSTMKKITMADGSNGFINPETKYIKEAVTMFWASTTSAFRTKILTYIQNGDKVRITDSEGDTYTGRFFNLKRVWFSGISDTFDVQISFELTV